MATHSLRVFDGSDLVGTVQYDALEDSFSFAYDEAWRSAAHRYPLSPAIPFDRPASSASLRRFIENLLPEGRALDIASVYGQVSKNNVYGLIRQLGGETAGALSFHADAPPPAQAPQLREISAAELNQRIRDREQVPLHRLGWPGSPVHRRLPGQTGCLHGRGAHLPGRRGRRRVHPHRQTRAGP
ncbi:HipA N-terminal domain-containing protein [Cupriavidus basilensis]